MVWKTLKQSPIVPAKVGTYPFRVVLRHFKDRNEYVTHVKVMPSHEKPYYVWGHYFTNLKDAEEDFRDRVKREMKSITPP